MPDTENEFEAKDEIEDHVALTQADGFELPSSEGDAHGRHLFADPKDGKEKEATLLSHHAGASSEAPSGSGVPSAMTQDGVRRQAVADQETTPFPDRHSEQPTP